METLKKRFSFVNNNTQYYCTETSINYVWSQMARREMNLTWPIFQVLPVYLEKSLKLIKACSSSEKSLNILFPMFLKAFSC